MEAIIHQAILDHARAVRQIEKMPQAQKEYEEIKFLLARAIKYQTAGGRRDKTLRGRIFKIVLARYQRYLRIKKAEDLKKEVESFFRSRHFGKMCSIDGERIIQRMYEMEGRRKDARNKRQSGGGHGNDNG